MFIILIGFFIFDESLTNKQLFGFLIGFFVFIILYEKDISNNKNIKKMGFIFLGFSILFIVLTNFFKFNIKYIDFNIFNFLFLDGVFGTIFLFIMNYKKINFSNSKKIFLKNYKLIFSISSIKYLSIIFYVNSFLLIPYGIAFKINSFSILIPILLSAYFLKEEIKTRQILAIILSIISIYFFF